MQPLALVLIVLGILLAVFYSLLLGIILLAIGVVVLVA